MEMKTSTQDLQALSNYAQCREYEIRSARSDEFLENLRNYPAITPNFPAIFNEELFQK